MTVTSSSPSIHGRDFDVFVETLDRYGGGWARQFAALLRCSDPSRKARLLAAFPDQVGHYGPGSNFFSETENYLQQESVRIAEWLTTAPTEDFIPF